MPPRTIPPLSEILAASELLDDGDIPADNSTALGKTPLYVATDGDDQNDGLSIGSPLQHLTAAIRYTNERPGTPYVIYLRGGVHYSSHDQEYTEIGRGDLMITAFPGEQVTLRPHFWPGDPADWGEEVCLYSWGGCDNITISDLTLQGWEIPLMFGATFDEPPMRNLVIRNITANEFRRRGPGFGTGFFSTNYVDRGYFAGRDFDPSDPGIKYQIDGLIIAGIRLEGVDVPVGIGDEDDANVRGLRISDVEVRNPLQGSGDSAQDGFAIVNCDKVLIDDCLIDNMLDDGIDTKSFDVCVVNTLVRGAGRNGVKFWHGGELINSIIYDCTRIDDGAFIIDRGRCRMVHSLLTRKSVGYAGTFSYGGAVPETFEITNSIFADLDHTFYVDTADLRSMNTLYFDMPDGLFSGSREVAGVAELNALANCSGNISADPRLKDPEGEDFALQAGSPCRDAGTPAGVLLPSFDYLGNRRPWEAGRDIGPCEYGAPPLPDRNYVNLEVVPAEAAPGGEVRVNYRIDFGLYNFEGRPVNVYVAAIRGPVVSDAPSSPAAAASGGAVYLFGRGMQRAYLYGGSAAEPTFAGAAFPPAPSSGSIPLSIPPGEGYAGDWVVAAVFIYRDTGGFVRTDGLPVENSNTVRIR